MHSMYKKLRITTTALSTKCIYTLRKKGFVVLQVKRINENFDHGLEKSSPMYS